MGAKDEDEKVAFEESQSHTSPHLNLDAGDQIYRIRTSWWKLWYARTLQCLRAYTLTSCA